MENKKSVIELVPYWEAILIFWQEKILTCPFDKI